MQVACILPPPRSIASRSVSEKPLANPQAPRPSADPHWAPHLFLNGLNELVRVDCLPCRLRRKNQHLARRDPDFQTNNLKVQDTSDDRIFDLLRYRNLPTSLRVILRVVQRDVGSLGIQGWEDTGVGGDRSVIEHRIPLLPMSTIPCRYCFSPSCCHLEVMSR